MCYATKLSITKKLNKVLFHKNFKKKKKKDPNSNSTEDGQHGQRSVEEVSVGVDLLYLRKTLRIPQFRLRLFLFLSRIAEKP
jgi:hypothetical protein